MGKELEEIKKEIKNLKQKNFALEAKLDQFRERLNAVEVDVTSHKHKITFETSKGYKVDMFNLNSNEEETAEYNY